MKAPPVVSVQRPHLYRTAGIARVLLGLFFLVPGSTKFLDHATQVDSFAHWGVPTPGLAVYVVGAVELTAGVALLLGVWMPLPALVLTSIMLGALATAGQVDGGGNIVAPVAVLAVLLFVLGRWGGAFQLCPPPPFLRARTAVR